MYHIFFIHSLMMDLVDSVILTVVLEQERDAAVLCFLARAWEWDCWTVRKFWSWFYGSHSV